MSIAAEVYNRMLLNPIYQPIFKIVRSYQAGFRKKRNCLKQIHALRRIMEAYYQRQFPHIAVFIDIQQTSAVFMSVLMAFSSVDREMMWRILRNYEIPQKIASAIVAIYSSNKSRVRLGRALTEAFQFYNGPFTR